MIRMFHLQENSFGPSLVQAIHDLEAFVFTLLVMVPRSALAKKCCRFTLERAW